ncbi:hypothetical protein LOK46_13340 [Methylobacterium sp. NMS14P]|uniref:hypothetical protein n=1 Tax=Methylobacterium sp. NMS14P TaxID=2894310 RepID=UPI00235880C8|nr:hypothetical protein [Methylobacterium sp. NMS14P]WCS27758.1 hypothetical protein LOK46_13340 [Methylobacterium sp. NMS14P]
MIEDTDPNREIVIERLMDRLEGFAVGIGLDRDTTRRLVDRVITDMPLTPDEDRLARVRNWMLIASA